MKQKRSVFLLVLGLLIFSAGFSYAQENARFLRSFQNGSQLYRLTHWNEAAAEFRRAQETAVNLNEWASALYWVILSELAYADYGSALRDMEDLTLNAPHSSYARDMVYHRARIYYNQGYYEDALHQFNNYNATTSDENREAANRRAAAFFWMGECLYAMGQLDEAEKFYAWVIARYPQSPKIEAATYRIDLINQKKIEAELLALLQWSHEESLRTSEDYQRTLRTYEHTLNMYQRRIAELSTSDSIEQIRSIEPGVNDFLQHNEDIPPVLVEDISRPVQSTPSPGFIINNPSDRLIERARELGNDVNGILRDNNAGRR
ncbi:MAG: tetratricopeptide repeat protein [Treponema sp.]|jgi:TolA-binding protein|nr:tetratricopeptide repeat protein [Treponema sp.]